jgi:hypothetical protein
VLARTEQARSNPFIALRPARLVELPGEADGQSASSRIAKRTTARATYGGPIRKAWRRLRERESRSGQRAQPPGLLLDTEKKLPQLL